MDSSSIAVMSVSKWKKSEGGVLLQEKIPEAKKSQARDEAGRAAGIFSEPSKKNMIHSETRRITTNFPKVPLARV